MSRLNEIKKRASEATKIKPTRIIPSAPKYYAAVSGFIWSNTNWRGIDWRLLSPHIDQHGYLRVAIVKDGKRRNRPVHSLVCEAFHGSKPSENHEVRHLDGDRLNNHPDNLCWGTRKENAADRSSHGMTAVSSRNGSYKTHCKRGHDLNVTGKFRKGGGRECVKCKNVCRK